MYKKKHIFSQSEKQSFVDILKRYKMIIESKQTDSAALTRKNEAWEKITSEYNANIHTSCQVQMKQLRRLWTNLNQRQREALRRRREQNITIKTEAGAESGDQPQVEAPSATLNSFYSSNSDTSDSEFRDQPMKERESMGELDNLQELQKELLREKIREARAKADLAELLLRKQQAAGYS